MFEMGSTLSSWFQCALPCWFRSAHDQQRADTWRHVTACQPWPTVPCPSAFSQPASQQKVPSSTFLCASLGQLALQLETFSLPFLTHESVPCSLSPLAADPLSPRETQKISPVSVGYSHAPLLPQYLNPKLRRDIPLPSLFLPWIFCFSPRVTPEFCLFHQNS